MKDISIAALGIFQQTLILNLVSAICKIMDEKLPQIEHFANVKEIWTVKGVREAVKILCPC